MTNDSGDVTVGSEPQTKMKTVFYFSIFVRLWFKTKSQFILLGFVFLIEFLYVRTLINTNSTHLLPVVGGREERKKKEKN